MKQVKNNLNLNVLLNLLESNSPAQISKQLNIPKQNLQYYLSSLKKHNLIEKIGYGTWKVKEVKKSSNHTFIPKEVRGHAFVWKIKVPKEALGYNKLNKINHLKYKLLGIKRTPRIILLNKKIWLGNSNIIIYDSNSYLSNNAIESRKLAVYRLLTIIQELENKLTISLKTKNGYQFKPTREHYSLVNNDLAIQMNEKGERLYVRHHGETWFIVDNSYNLNEAETIHKETALTDNLGIQRYFNQHKELKYEVTPKFILESINKVTNNQLMFAKNLESHVKAMNDISESNRLLQETIKELKEVINHGLSK